MYSYKDGPDFPGPLSRSLLVVGLADRSLSAVQKVIDIVDDTTEVNEDLQVHPCTIAVQLADEKKRFDRLEKRHQINSVNFAKFFERLRKSRRVSDLQYSRTIPYFGY